MKEQFPKPVPEPEIEPEVEYTDRKAKKDVPVMTKVARYDANLAAIRMKDARNKNPSKKPKRDFHAEMIDEKLIKLNRVRNPKKTE